MQASPNVDFVENGSRLQEMQDIVSRDEQYQVSQQEQSQTVVVSLPIEEGMRRDAGESAISSSLVPDKKGFSGAEVANPLHHSSGTAVSALERSTATTDTQATEVHRAIRWGGRFKTTLLGKHHRDVNKYTNEELGVHGLKEAFDGTNGWGRSLLYFSCFICFGAFFLFLTIPLVQEYMDRAVITSIKTVSVVDGLPLPIITVCPMGKGVRCDCLLWRQLHCRYRFPPERNLTWMARFDLWSCWPNFDFDNLTDGQYPRWIDPGCDDFLPNSTVVLDDTCGPSASDKGNMENWTEYTTEALFKKIVMRETLPDGPYLTNEELLVYGSVKLEEKVSFYRSSDIYVEWIKNETVIEEDYQEWSRMKRCIQLRVPPEDDRHRQLLPGASYGILAVVTDVSPNDFPLIDMSRAAAAVEINVNYVEPKRYADAYLPIDGSEFIDIPAGLQTTLEFELQTLTRKPGWGSSESRSCSSGPLPRNLCIKELLLTRAAMKCNCRPSGSSFAATVLDCSANEGTREHTCVNQFLRNVSIAAVPLSVCPEECESLFKYPIQHSTIPLTKPQINYLKNLEVLAARPVELLPANTDGTPVPYAASTIYKPFDNITEDSTVMLRVGLGKMNIRALEELPSLSLGALLGAIGGNAGLWCGISFSLIVEIAEFSLIAILYGNGFFHKGGRAAKRSLHNSAFSVGRAKRSKH